MEENNIPLYANIGHEFDHVIYKKLIITPILSVNQFGPASLDIRLGSTILIPKRSYSEGQDVTVKENISCVEKRLHERVRLQYHQKFVLHPQQLILGSTLEYICLPESIFSTLASRYSWGRLGLVIATASIVQPGFRGSLTLELCNLSESPIVLYPGLLIGQLVFFDCEYTPDFPGYIKTGRYTYPTEAGMPQFFAKDADKEMSFWGGGEE